MFTEHTNRQRRYSDATANERLHEKIDYRGSPVHELIRELPIRKLIYLLRRKGISLNGKRLLIVGCGLGTDVYYLSRYAKAELFGIDISQQNASVTRGSFPEIQVAVADSETLPFDDSSFDYVFVCDSLHHMARPYLGIYEMLRLAREAVCIIEPHDCLLTRFATHCGLMQEYEDAGNYVLKLSRRDLARLARSFCLEFRTASLFATDFSILERLPAYFRRLFFPVFRIVTGTLNRIVPWQGNTFVGVVFK